MSIFNFRNKKGSKKDEKDLHKDLHKDIDKKIDKKEDKLDLNKKRIELKDKVMDLKPKITNVPKKLKFNRVVFLDAGFGFSEPGGGRDDYYSYIPNAQVTYELAKLLSSKYDVFVTQPLIYAGTDLAFVNDDNSETNVYTILNAIKPKGKQIVGYDKYSDCYSAQKRKNAINQTIKYLKETFKTKLSIICALSLQHNCVGKNEKNKDVEGMEVYYNDTDVYTDYREQSKKLCENILKCCKNIYGSKDRKENLKGNNFLVTQVDCPAAYVEIEFIDNLNKQKIIADRDKQKKMAQGLKDAIDKTFKKKLI